MIHRGEIYFVNLNPTKGRKQRGRRPVLVVSVDAINSQPLVVAVVVGTDAKKVPRDYPVNVRLSAEETGLPQDTVFLCFQIRSLDASRFQHNKGALRPAGNVQHEHMVAVDKAFRNVLGL